MTNKWVKIVIHYVTTFAVGGVATLAFKWNASQWLIYFVMCDFWFILREMRNTYD